MQLFTVHDVIGMAVAVARIYFDFNAVFAAEAVKEALLPFQEFNVTNCLASLGAGVILWRKKSWILSGLFHRFD